MESRWRLNVAEMGMVGSGWQLAARLLPLYEPSQGVVVRMDGFPYVALYIAYPDSVPVYFGHVGEIGARFPGPFPVEPD